MSKPDKYVVIYELGNGYMNCIGIYDNAEQAYGEAYLSLIDGLDPATYVVTMPQDREGENGCVLSVVNKETWKEDASATVLFYRKECEQNEE